MATFIKNKLCVKVVYDTFKVWGESPLTCNKTQRMAYIKKKQQLANLIN